LTPRQSPVAGLLDVVLLGGIDGDVERGGKGIRRRFIEAQVSDETLPRRAGKLERPQRPAGGGEIGEQEVIAFRCGLVERAVLPPIIGARDDAPRADRLVRLADAGIAPFMRQHYSRRAPQGLALTPFDRIEGLQAERGRPAHREILTLSGAGVGRTRGRGRNRCDAEDQGAQSAAQAKPIRRPCRRRSGFAGGSGTYWR
jgi:hypothetical protein